MFVIFFVICQNCIKECTLAPLGVYNDDYDCTHKS